MNEIQNLVNNPSNSMNFGNSSYPSYNTPSYDNVSSMNFGTYKKSPTNWTAIIIGFLIIVVIGLLIGLYFNKCECVCEVSGEPFGSVLSARPILNPLIGPNSAKLEKERERGQKPVGYPTLPSKYQSKDAPYASETFTMHK